MAQPASKRLVTEANITDPNSVAGAVVVATADSAVNAVVGGKVDAAVAEQMSEINTQVEAAQSAATDAGAARDQAEISATTLNTWFLRGSGSPVGVITPSSAGVQYVDTAQTCGARVWISTGTTASAWHVVDGDTGWRNISSLLTGCNSGSLLIRRYGTFADLSIRSILPSSTSSFTFVTLPTGFTRTDGTYTYIPARPSSSLTMQNILLKGFNECGLSLSEYSSSHGDFSYSLSYRSTVWPTTLPGTPA